MPSTRREATSPSRVSGSVPGRGAGWAASGREKARTSEAKKSRDRSGWGNMAPTQDRSRQRRNGKLNRGLEWTARGTDSGSGGKFGVAGVEELPVDDFGEGPDVLIPAVLVLEVIGVFPEIDAEEDLAALDEWGVLVGGRFEFEGTILVDAEPEPAAAEDAEGGLDEVFAGFLGIGGVEGLEKGLAEGVAGAGAFIATEGFPEQGMVDVAAGVVADGGADPFGDLVEIGEEFLGGMLVEIGVVSDGLVEVVDVAGVMFAVMDLHRLGIDVRFEGIEGITQRREFVGADGSGLGEDVAGGNGSGGDEGGAEGLPT